MMSELINCKTCGGKVSTAATKCPHCGEPYFKSDSYLQKVKREQAQQALESQRQIEKEQGPELCIWASGDYIVPKAGWSDWRDFIEFDGKRYTQIASQTESHGEGWAPTHVRLTPGRHTVAYVNYVGSTYNRHKEETPENHTFIVTPTSYSITLNIKKAMFKSHYYKIVSVVVN